MKRLVIVALMAVAVVCWMIPSGVGQQRNELKDFMRVKLRHSQKVLDGLVMENFDEVAKNAQELSLLSLAATWQVFETPEYVDYSRKFRNAADSLAEAAKKKDLDRATLAFNQVTTRCVECHKYVRGVRMADASK
ncbi:MAG: cytochrome c [Pirellulales bacterium]